MKAMRAKYNGRCKRCGGNLYAGDMIRYSRDTGALHSSDEVCDSYLEQRAEMELETQAEYRMAGLSAEDYYRDRDYDRGVRVGNDHDEYDAFVHGY